MLEVASESTADVDVGDKRKDYAALGIPEYWRFDETGEYHGKRLSGERLVDSGYVPVEIEELPGGSLQGYSPVLDLNIRWEGGELVFYDPATDRPILTYEDQRAHADSAEAHADSAREALMEEQAARAQAESRVLELEAELNRLMGG